MNIKIEKVEYFEEESWEEIVKNAEFGTNFKGFCGFFEVDVYIIKTIEEGFLVIYDAPEPKIDTFTNFSDLTKYSDLELVSIEEINLAFFIKEEYFKKKINGNK